MSNWTKEKPTVPGWYWWLPEKLAVRAIRVYEGLHDNLMATHDTFRDGSVLLNELRGHWHPIPDPPPFEEPLKPCPFCGSRDAPAVEDTKATMPNADSGWWVVCQATTGGPGGCGGSSGWCATKAEARAAWNRRTE